MIFKKIVTSFLFILCANFLQAQTNSLLFKGKITFERKLNLHKQFDEIAKMRPGGGSFAEQMKKNSPKYKTDIFELKFTTSKALYKPTKDGISESKGFMSMVPAEKNIVFTNVENKNYSAEKTLFEKTFLIQDSLKKINWKIKEEFRTIAGYPCRRAEAILMDSIYIIAFYSDAIIAPVGPESFNGLPGMILGIVIPRMNLTYFATKVENFLNNEEEIIAPTKGEKKSLVEIEKGIRDKANNWGNFIDKSIWFLNI